MNTKNRSIRKVYKYKFTMKPEISCELDSRQVLKHYQESPWPK